ncbi:MAG: NAD(P)H-dependent oxidoreductase subunit E [Planctomycetes bacterium]|jgi:NADH-quinone oxidoreductase subunit E|nr:NAD(P)H-dependent oxidoreductase subunit E [Planctomycetota bacterium]
MTTATTPNVQEDLQRIAKKWKDKPGSLIMVLHEVQERLGCVPRNVCLELAKLIDVPVARIYEVVTFYNYFKTEAPGKHILSVCTGTACHLKGASKVLESLSKELGIKEGESSADKEFHLQSVRCVGCCGMAPVVMVNGAIHGKLKPESSGKEIVAQYRGK